MKLSAERLAEIRIVSTVNWANPREVVAQLIAHIDAQAAEIASLRKVLEAAEVFEEYIDEYFSSFHHTEWPMCLDEKQDPLANAIKAHKEKYPDKDCKV